MGKKIVVALAPVGGWGEGRNNPLEPARIAEEVARCAEAGASLVHLHARDRAGRLTTDLSTWLETSRRIRESCGILIEASTGGLSELSAEERALSLKSPEASFGSLNIGSINFQDQVYRNSVPDARLWVRRMAEAGKKPNLEIFDTAHVAIAELLIEEGLVKPQFNFNFVFDYRWGMRFSLPLLEVLKSSLPSPSVWGAVFGGNRDFRPHLQAVLHGAAMVRVGFEDSPVCNGREAVTNLELVEELRRELEVLGFEAASPAEAARILGLG